MKIWTIDEFLNECKELRDNQYTYDYDNMPKGYCNKHEVRPSKLTWSTIVIDDIAYSLKCSYLVENRELTAIEYIRRILEEPYEEWAIVHEGDIIYTGSRAWCEETANEIDNDGDLEVCYIGY